MSNKKSTIKQYNETEVAQMAKDGYITPRAAATLAHVRVERVYRAIKAEHVRAKLNDTGYNKYVHKADWLAFIKAVRARTKGYLGIS